MNRVYMGLTITRAPLNASGIRWIADNPNGGYLRADTLAGLRELIKFTLNKKVTS